MRHRLEPAQPILDQLAEPSDNLRDSGQELAEPPIAKPVLSVGTRSEDEKRRDIYEGIWGLIVGVSWAAVVLGFLLSVSESSYDGGATFQGLYSAVCIAAAFIIPLLALIGYRLGKIARALKKHDSSD